MDIQAAHRLMDRYARRIEHPDVYNVSIAATDNYLFGFVVYLKTEKPHGGFHASRVIEQVENLCKPYLGATPWVHISEPVADRPLHKHIFRCSPLPVEHFLSALGLG